MGRVRGAPPTNGLRWGPETLQTPQLQKLGIVINVDHKVAICLECSSAIPPAELYNHLRKHGHHLRQDFHHGQRLAFATRDFCKRLIRRYRLEDPRLRGPTAIITAIFGLPVREGFLRCTGCGYAAQTSKTMTRYHTTTHCDGTTIVEGPCQTWFPTSRRQYFGVQLHDHSGLDQIDPVALFIEQFSLDPYENIPIQATTHPRDMNIFLRYENWLGEVEGMTGAQIFDIAWNALPKLRPMVCAVVSEYVSVLVKELEGTDPEQRLAIGDYDEYAFHPHELSGI